MNDVEADKKKRQRIIIIVVVVIVIIVLIIAAVLIWLWWRNRRPTVQAVDCKSDTDCGLNFKCNVSTGACSQCLVDADCPSNQVCNGVVCVGCNEDADCESGQECRGSTCVFPCSQADPTCPTGQVCNTFQERCVAECTSITDCGTGETCDGGACVCPIPVIEDAFASVGSTWPITLTVSVTPVGTTSGLEYKATFRGNGWEVGTPYQNSAPILLALPGNCGGPNATWGCPSACGSGYSASGVVEVQIRNSCGNESQIFRLPVSGECDLCSGQVCQ